MIDGNEMWNCVKWVIGSLLAVALCVGIFIGIIFNFVSGKTNATPTCNKMVGRLEDGSPKHSIPKNTQIVAACADNFGIFAYIVRDTSGNHYYVGLSSREVRKIEEANVVTLSKTISEPNHQEFNYKVKEL